MNTRKQQSTGQQARTTPARAGDRRTVRVQTRDVVAHLRRLSA